MFQIRSFLQYHIDRGSKISLVCVIENAPEPPQWVWFFLNLAQFLWVSHVTLPFSLRSAKTFFSRTWIFFFHTHICCTYVRTMEYVFSLPVPLAHFLLPFPGKKREEKKMGNIMSWRTKSTVWGRPNVLLQKCALPLSRLRKNIFFKKKTDNLPILCDFRNTLF